MKTFIYSAIIGLLHLILSTSPVGAQAQEIEGYTFVRTVSGTSVCLGRWIPPRSVGLPGRCEGELVDVSQLNAVSARTSAEKLDQIFTFLVAIDEKMAINNDQVSQLIGAATATQASIEEQVRQMNELERSRIEEQQEKTAETLQEAINKRFEELPKAILESDVFKEEMEKLRKDILEEVGKHYVKRVRP
jgi:hypothetical protein